MKNILVLGSTGSIGVQTLNVIYENKKNFRPFTLVAGENVNSLIKQSLKFNPKKSIIFDKKKYQILKENLKNTNIIVESGEVAINEAISDEKIDLVVVAINGFKGLKFVLEAIKCKKIIALANKETIVTGGKFLMNKIKNNNIFLIPIDSEHSAIFQCLKGEKKYLKKIILTASGGPFRNFNKKKDFENINKKMALKHPVWKMGDKITIDSATLANKGLEIIEAHYLFDCPYDNIEVLIHKESIIHSMIELFDNSIIAQLGLPDMKIPILYSLSYPERFKNFNSNIDFLKIKSLNFSKPKKIFKSLELAFFAGKEGDAGPIIYNTANEVAVDLFLKEKISFLEISNLIQLALEKVKRHKIDSYESILNIDKITRNYLLKKG